MRVVSREDVAEVWSGHPVGFALRTVGRSQYVAYYDADRVMQIACREPGAPDWRVVALPETVGWDSHNFIALAEDRDGLIHLSGNMHCDPLVYFRSRRPHDPTTLERVRSMVGADEGMVTYPHFLVDAAGEMVFLYRDGSSGDGRQIVNRWDRARGAWNRISDVAMLSGGGAMSAYPDGPVAGPDGVFHMAWVWRDTPDCRTNHDLCYARSRDLVTWETAAGEPLPRPITPGPLAIVDPVPAGGGMINGNALLSFDASGRPVIAYHRYDDRGFTQAWVARWDGAAWTRRQVTDWRYRWDFHGEGAIPWDIRLAPVEVVASGELMLGFMHAEAGPGALRLDAETLEPLGHAEPSWPLPPALLRPEMDWPGIEVHWAHDACGGPVEGRRYALRWETLGSHRDRARAEPAPPPSRLQVITLEP